ncbi:hypothetical protein FHT26_005708 [Rhizobacter sp. SG703]|nr:hypothetical protein [Rhizobacter sp. SG703]
MLHLTSAVASRVLRMLLLAGFWFAGSTACAAEGSITGALQFVAVIQANAIGHQAGNLEVQVAGGFTVPTGMSCDPNYITTLKSVDADKRMFGLLSMALLAQKPVTLYITDNPAVTAFPGRCSLIAVTLQR